MLFFFLADLFTAFERISLPHYIECRRIAMRDPRGFVLGRGVLRAERNGALASQRYWVGLLKSIVVLLRMAQCRFTSVSRCSANYPDCWALLIVCIASSTPFSAPTYRKLLLVAPANGPGFSGAPDARGHLRASRGTRGTWPATQSATRRYKNGSDTFFFSCDMSLLVSVVLEGLVRWANQLGDQTTLKTVAVSSSSGDNLQTLLFVFRKHCCVLSVHLMTLHKAVLVGRADFIRIWSTQAHSEISRARMTKESTFCLFVLVLRFCHLICVKNISEPLRAGACGGEVTCGLPGT
jgi:hypothetical protein